MDLVGHMEACLHESILTQRSCVQSGTYMDPQPRNKCEIEGGMAEVYG